ncbi:MAG: pyridoxamine 5'-phosphate oxidase family protein [Spirochaetales bacterium]|nr:pyridoxamine 5'-phosphate oxidase family protein [Spirochaetales bacterium]
MGKKTRFSKEDIKAFEPENKVGLIATVSPEGLPHITLISTILAKDAGQITWGQFSEGNSKTNVKNNPKTGFLIMTMDKQLWRGKAQWLGSLMEGEDYEKLNKLSMWRYNTYMGIHTVHYMDLVETTEKEPLPLSKIIISSILTMVSKKGAASKNKTVMNSWTMSLYNKMDSLKFLSFLGKDGFPTIIPLLQCQAADSTRLVFNTVPYKDELSSLETGSDIAIFGMTLQMEDVLVRGKFSGFGRYNGIKLGIVDINWVYNSMPPKAGQIYPEVKLEKVVNF